MDAIDGYTHCGLTKYQPIERVRQVMAAAGVGRAVLAQHIGEFDNAYLGQVAIADPDHLAAVCLVNHEEPDCAATLRRWASTGRFKGLRLSLEALSIRPELAEATVDAGLILLLYTPQGISREPVPLLDFMERRPEARVVVSHLGNPDLATAPGFADYDAVWRLAEYPNTYMQISGMKMFCRWPHEPLYPLIERARERFGAKRLYWGSNFPVVGDADDYRQDLALVLEGRLPLPESEIVDLAAGNAARLWFPEG